ncbi:hypothetical protein ES703_56173 [subsurface metagenome]
MQILLSESFVWMEFLSAVEYAETLSIPSSLQALIILIAISPLFAINILLNIKLLFISLYNH